MPHGAVTRSIAKRKPPVAAVFFAIIGCGWLLFCVITACMSGGTRLRRIATCCTMKTGLKSLRNDLRKIDSDRRDRFLLKLQKNGAGVA